MRIYIEPSEIETLAQTISKRFWSYGNISYPRSPKEDYRLAYEVAETHYKELLQEAQSSVLILVNLISELLKELEDSEKEG